MRLCERSEEELRLRDLDRPLRAFGDLLRDLERPRWSEEERLRDFDLPRLSRSDLSDEELFDLFLERERPLLFDGDLDRPLVRDLLESELELGGG